MKRLEGDTVTRALWRLLRDRPGEYAMADLVRETHGSKTAIRKALAQLEEVGFIRISDEAEER